MVLYLNAFSPIFITSGSLIIILIISLENIKITIDHIKEYKVVISIDFFVISFTLLIF